MTVIDGDRRIHTLSSYVGGQDVEGARWVYTCKPKALMEDSFATMTLKRRLEQGEIDLSEVSPDLVVGRVAIAEPETVRAAARSAHEAIEEWRRVPLSVRLEDWYALLQQVIRDHTEEMVWAMSTEGHPIDLARWEITGMYESTRPESAAYIRSQLWQDVSTTPLRQDIVRRQPDGVVAVNPPANAALVSALFAALCVAAGNTCVVRAPRSGAFAVTYALRKLIVPTLDQIGAPPGVLNIICSEPKPTLDSWIESPHVNDIMYFGDVPNGQQVEQRCVQAGKKPVLELAGNDAVMVWHDADLDRAADAIVECFHGSGQICMIPNHVIVHPSVSDDLISRVVERAEQLKPGYPSDSGVLLSPVLRHDKFLACLKDATEKGATLLTGGRGMQTDGSADDAGFFIQPTVLRIDGLDNSRDLLAVKYETFFPLMPIVVAEDLSDEELLDNIIRFVNTNEYGLRNSFWTSDDKVIDKVLENVVNAGLLKINDSHVAFHSPLPTHGGNGWTGGAFGEANYPALRTTHLQGVSVTRPSQGSIA